MNAIGNYGKYCPNPQFERKDYLFLCGQWEFCMADEETAKPAFDRKIVVLEEKSPTILLSLLQKRITIGNMNDAIADLTVEELMEIEPGTLFDNEKLRTAAIDDVSVVATEIFKEMTVGELLTYSNVAVDREITYILQSVRIPDFFSSLVFNSVTATIEVDMYELFGV